MYSEISRAFFSGTPREIFKIIGFKISSLSTTIELHYHLRRSGGVESTAVLTLHRSIEKKYTKNFMDLSTSINFSPLFGDVTTSLFFFFSFPGEMDGLIDFLFVRT